LNGKLGTDPTNPPLLGSPAEVPLSSANIRLIQRWLNNCEQQHPTCKRFDSSDILPTHLVYTKLGHVRLLETRNLNELEKDSIRYVALSYCWGTITKSEYKTTTRNFQDRILGIKPKTLPQNFEHAIFLTQSLGIDYLWIDSLCIIQDFASGPGKPKSRLCLKFMLKLTLSSQPRPQQMPMKDSSNPEMTLFQKIWFHDGVLTAQLAQESR
jgi:hypothetical protein